MEFSNAQHSWTGQVHRILLHAATCSDRAPGQGSASRGGGTEQGAGAAAGDWNALAWLACPAAGTRLQQLLGVAEVVLYPIRPQLLRALARLLFHPPAAGGGAGVWVQVCYSAAQQPGLCACVARVDVGTFRAASGADQAWHTERPSPASEGLTLQTEC